MRAILLAEFADQLNSVMQVVTKEFAKRQVNELYKGKITLPQFFVLDHLHLNAEAKMKDLAACMDVTTAAITGIVDRLVRVRLAVRCLEPHDRRIIKVRLTPSGEALLKKIHEQKRKMVIDIFGKISEDDRREYLRILTQVKEVLHKEPK